ncbi:MAG TPA: endonuclease/exonuclease/phosphatase family protein [Phycisphaerales bacterium]|nr:endonuclease/exonuclease/phosphatase family protein [Phycisphaerales bacterium]HMP36201.1 endonuclease/exonuclease/phosphatase family protein [Phycisphaerales bacterium]
MTLLPPLGRVRASVAILCVIALAIWAAGRLLNDRWLGTQALFWVPSILTLIPSWLLVAALWKRGALRHPGTIAALGLAAGLSAWLFMVEHRPLRRGPTTPAETPGLRIYHRNLHWPNRRAAPALLEAIIDRSDDLILLTEPGWLLLEERGKALIEAGWILVRSGRYAILSHIPILEVRSLVRRHDLDITMLRVDASSRGLGALTIALVDLPSNPLIGRMNLARELRYVLDQELAPDFDIAVGDFNATRGSAAIAALFPGMRHAWDDAGRGWSGSWPSPLPLWHIDHVLLGPELRATDHRLLGDRILRHRAQEAVIERR